MVGDGFERAFAPMHRRCVDMIGPVLGGLPGVAGIEEAVDLRMTSTIRASCVVMVFAPSAADRRGVCLTRYSLNALAPGSQSGIICGSPQMFGHLHEAK